MILNYKYRLYPTKSQQARLNQQSFVANQAWNYALNIRQRDLKNKTGFTNINLINNYVKTKLKIRNISANTGVIQQSIRNLDNTLKIFFKNKDDFSFPVFKKSHSIQQGFETKNQGIQITEKYFKIFKMKIKWKYHREIPNKPTKVIVKREPDGKYYVIFSVKIIKNNLEKTGKNCGIDLNIKNIAVAERGKAYLIALKKMDKYNKKYMKIQKKLSVRYDKKSRSKNTKKLQKKQNKLYSKVKSVKENFFHQLSNQLVENFDSIRVEKLEKKKMKEEAPSKRLRRDIAEVSWDSLIQKIKYKTERYGKVFEEINPAYTSQRCNRCGYISRKNRVSQAIFKCKKCSHQDNADCNAAKNILEYDKWFLEQKTRWDARHIESSAA